MKTIVRIIVFQLCVLLLWGCSGPDESRHPLFQKARRAERSKDFETAVSYYKRYLKVRPDSTRAHLTLAAIYDENMANPAASIYHYERFLELEPQSGRAAEAKKMLAGVRKRYYLKMKDVYNDPETVEALKNDLVGLQDNQRQLLEKNKKLEAFLDVYKAQIVKLSAARKEAEQRQVSVGKDIVMLRAKINVLEEELRRERQKTQTPVVADGKKVDAPAESPKLPEAETEVEVIEPGPPAAVAAAPAPSAPTESKTPVKKTVIYKVRQGDTLSSIARHFYGRFSRYRDIMEANKEKLPDPRSLKVGMELVIPDLPPDGSNMDKAEKKTSPVTEVSKP